MKTELERTPENLEYMEKASIFFRLVEQVECNGDSLRYHELVNAAMSWAAAGIRAVHAGTHPAALTMINGTAWFEAKHRDDNC
jgi:hypothetical protein